MEEMKNQLLQNVIEKFTNELYTNGKVSFLTTYEMIEASVRNSVVVNWVGLVSTAVCVGGTLAMEKHIVDKAKREFISELRKHPVVHVGFF